MIACKLCNHQNQEDTKTCAKCGMRLIAPLVPVKR